VAGYQTLVRAIESGTPLRPWRSTLVRKLNERDELLDDWGIHHFHLGIASHEKRAAFVARTDDVAFALVRPDAVYFLTATSHDPETAPLVGRPQSDVGQLPRSDNGSRRSRRRPERSRSKPILVLILASVR
jgi:hypothetical protein